MAQIILPQGKDPLQITEAGRFVLFHYGAVSCPWIIRPI